MLKIREKTTVAAELVGRKTADGLVGADFRCYQLRQKRRLPSVWGTRNDKDSAGDPGRILPESGRHVRQHQGNELVLLQVVWAVPKVYRVIRVRNAYAAKSVANGC